MKVGFIVSRNRVASCFAGNELLVYSNLLELDEHEVVSTSDWQLRDWVTELMKRDVGQLVCSGIDRFLNGTLRGNGVTVSCGIVGSIDVVIDRWRQGLIVERQEYGGRGHRCRGGRKRCRKGGEVKWGLGNGTEHRCTDV